MSPLRDSFPSIFLAFIDSDTICAAFLSKFDISHRLGASMNAAGLLQDLRQAE